MRPQAMRSVPQSQKLFEEAEFWLCSARLPHKAPVARVEFSPDGEAASKAYVAFSKDGRRIATAEDGTVQLWNAADGQLLSTIPVNGFSHNVHFSPDGENLLITSGRTAIVYRPIPLSDLQ